jgi:hypothetical protein
MKQLRKNIFVLGLAMLISVSLQAKAEDADFGAETELSNTEEINSEAMLLEQNSEILKAPSTIAPVAKQPKHLAMHVHHKQAKHHKPKIAAAKKHAHSKKHHASSDKKQHGKHKKQDLFSLAK